MFLQENFVNLKPDVFAGNIFSRLMFLQARLSVDKLGEHFPACSGKIREVGLPVVGFSFFLVAFCYILVVRLFPHDAIVIFLLASLCPDNLI